jgi:hypothetical protein
MHFTYYILCDRTCLILNMDTHWKGTHIRSIGVSFLVNPITLLNVIMRVYICKRELTKVGHKQRATWLLSPRDLVPYIPLNCNLSVLSFIIKVEHPFT